jgi:NADH:ubiquinone oxidoreductase subunit F (NADH-binding)/NADH:ubiquinone oxidoreductase subunit E/Pyruvate/2-oxoacid:ferredoxin oxidoreductase delta subunit
VSETDHNTIEQIVERIGRQSRHALPLLQAVQAQYGYLPLEVLHQLCEVTECTPSQLWSIATFYDQFRLKPAGRHVIKVCIGTACHVKGSSQIYEAFRRHLKMAADEDTDADRLFTVDRVACLGCCTLAPAVQIGEVTYGHVTQDTVGAVLTDFLERQKETGKRAAKKGDRSNVSPEGEIRIGLGSCCVARGSGKLLAAITQVMEETSIRAKVKHVGCVGMCYQTPLLEIISPSGKSTLYVRVEPQDAKSIILKHFQPPGRIRSMINSVHQTLDRILTDSIAEPLVRYPAEVRDPYIADFLNRQKHIATEHCGASSPVDLEEYRSLGGFTALEKAIGSLSPDEIINHIHRSGLRGRGGAGFPTHLKWTAVRSAESEKKYIVCNGDEGDPGAFMDRMLMESYPFRILEGMIIAARAVGAGQGYLYIREEYPLAVERISQAIELCRANGYLGRGIAGSDFSLDLQIYTGAGAFVCGEETALLKSIESKRPAPHLRPPYPASHGLWGLPTLINNVETYSLVPWIIQHGGDALAELGTAKSKGTKVFALAGKVVRGGLIEVPMGITVRQVIDEIGGGIADGRKLKAVQIGGPSGGCVPASMADIGIDYESLHTAGAIMGSGGMVVLDETDCMVDIARYFLEFTQNQSCGRCTFCRVGTKRMLEILERLCRGEGKQGDIEKLQELSRRIQTTSICGLGKTAPNPVLSTIEHFRDEYEAHIDGRCPAGKCRELIHYTITDECIGCTICAQHCPVDAIPMKPYEKHTIDQEACIRCGTCKNVCPVDAVEVK